MRTTTWIRDLVRDGDLEFSDGYRTKRPELAEAGFRIVRVADVGNGTVSLNGPDFVSFDRSAHVGEKRARGGDVLLTTKGTVGRVAIMPHVVEPVVYSPQLCYFRVAPKARILSGYLRYWFKSPEFIGQANFLMGKTDMAAYLSLGDIGSLSFTYPELTQQRAVAEVLGALDDKIAANGRVVEAAEGLLVAEASRSASTVAVHEIADHVKLSIRPTGVSGARVAHYSLPSFDGGKLPSFDETDSILSSKFSIQRPAVLFSKLNPRFPRVWDVPAPEEGAVASTEFLVLEPKGVSTTELWAALSQPELRTKLADRASGTSGSHQRVRPVEVMEAQVPDPRALAPAMREGFASSGERIALARVESRHLAALRDALLPELMSGRMTVAQAENQIEEVV